MRTRHSALPFNLVNPRDHIPGTPGDDTLTGTSGQDTLDGAAGADSMLGGAGNDTYIVDDAGDQVVELAGSGSDSVMSSVSYALGLNVEHLTLTGSADLHGTGNTLDNRLTGNSGANTLDGGDGRDTLSGGLGDDVLFGGAGYDYMDGGDGDDRVDGGASGGEMYGGSGNDTMTGDGGGAAFGGAGNDLLRATGEGGFELQGEDGDDTIVGGTGFSPGGLDGGAGNDVVRSKGSSQDLMGSEGNDTLIGDADYDYLDGGIGSDALNAGDGDDRLTDYDLTADTLAGGNGLDTLDANWTQSKSAIVWENNPELTQMVKGHTVSGIEVLSLSLGSGNDVISSLAVGDDVLHGGNGHDSLYGGAGDDMLYGEDDKDLIDGQAGDDWIQDEEGSADTLSGGDGIDTLDAAWFLLTEDIVWVNDPTQVQVVAGNQVSGFESLNILGGWGDDVISNLHGSGPGDFLSGEAGDDQLTTSVSHSIALGGDGNDTLVGGAACELEGNGGNDLLDGRAGSEESSFWGGTGNDTILGSAGSDFITGDSGKDTLSGGAGNDRLKGGSERDVFRFDTLVGADVVSDFAQGVDKIGVSQAGLQVGNGDAVVNGATTIATPGGFATTAELVIATANISGTITAAKAAATIGAASGNYNAGQTAVFAVDNGTDTAVYYFRSAGADANVSAAELTLLATLKDAGGTAIADYVFSA